MIALAPRPWPSHTPLVPLGRGEPIVGDLDLGDSAPSVVQSFPLQGTYTMTSAFGMRTSPTTGQRRMHEGQDFSVPVGTPVLAANAGTVRVARMDTASGCRGNYVVLDHGDGWDSRYFHLSVLQVAPGEWVEAGQQIGLSGKTGCVTGPHLHFEVWQDGAPVNPAPLLPGTPDTAAGVDAPSGPSRSGLGWVLAAFAAGVWFGWRGR